MEQWSTKCRGRLVCVFVRRSTTGKREEEPSIEEGDTIWHSDERIDDEVLCPMRRLTTENSVRREDRWWRQEDNYIWWSTTEKKRGFGCPSPFDIWRSTMENKRVFGDTVSERWRVGSTPQTLAMRCNTTTHSITILLAFKKWKNKMLPKWHLDALIVTCAGAFPQLGEVPQCLMDWGASCCFENYSANSSKFRNYMHFLTLIK